mmetsp:Transcript_504/g.719  ORF Transcript_504/g.719 Transcript_504/m.719 type:complete len:381 (+) Transcript_504:123-1265(+)
MILVLKYAIVGAVLLRHAYGFKVPVPNLAKNSKNLEHIAKSRPTPTLLLVTAAWGSQHSIAKIAIDSTSENIVPILTTARFAIAALALSPFFVWKKEDQHLIRQGIELGILAFAGFALQTTALQTTTATRSAFILYLNVKLVPIILASRGEMIDIFTWINALLAVIGTALLCLGSSENLSTQDLTSGDFLSLTAAAFSALFIVRLSDFASENPLQLSAISAVCTCLLSTIWLYLTTSTVDIFQALQLEASPFFILVAAALYLGFVPSALCAVLQATAQPQLPPSRAAILYALDPIFAAFFSHLFLGETLGGPIPTIGAILIATAAVALPLRDNIFLLLGNCEGKLESRVENEKTIHFSSFDIINAENGDDRLSGEEGTPR